MPVIFTNPGELELSLISTFGVSVKETGNPIGYFGTGLKFAIAVMLRHGLKVDLQAGEVSLAFGTREVVMRGEGVQVVTMGGIDLPFTTSLGRGWELWMAYRELYSNALDEGGSAFLAEALPAAAKGMTSIRVAGEDFERIHERRAEFFVDGVADLTFDRMEIRFAPSQAFFYRGIRVGTHAKPAALTYNDLWPHDLTEDRTLKTPYVFTYRIALTVMGCNDERLIRAVLDAPEGFMEASMDFDWSSGRPSATFLRIVGERAQTAAPMNRTIAAIWERAKPEYFAPISLSLSSVQVRQLADAIDFCRHNDFPIKCVETLGERVLGRAHEGKIYLTSYAFDIGGAKQVASTLIEEWVHIKHGFADCSRAMQTWLFDRLVTVAENLSGLTVATLAMAPVSVRGEIEVSDQVDDLEMPF